MAASEPAFVRDHAGNADESRSVPASTSTRPKLVTHAGESEQRLARLVRTIEVEIIPRLVLARWAAPECPSAPAPDGWTPGECEVQHLADLLLAQDTAAARSFIDSICARGASMESLYLDLLAPAARHLGDMWNADLCDFTQVTLGLCRLQEVLHELSPAFRNEADHREHGRRALLVPVPGEQHTFGLLMVAEFFRRAGWDVWSGHLASRNELIGIVRAKWFAVVGISVSSDRQLDALVSSIRAIRRASRNRAVGIMVGGPVFVEHPELVALVGADATAVDGRQATLQAQKLLALLPGDS